jgi:hypothetical protein
VAAFGAFSSVASAALIGTTEGNDCAGVYGANFGECAIPANIDPNETPIIIKFDIGGATEINSALFPTIDGTEFSFTGTGGASGTWTYNPGDGDPLINYYTAKGGNAFNLFSNDGDPNAGDWFTPVNPGGQPAGLSHIAFYDTDSGEGPGKVPEPTTMLLLGAGLLAVGIARRRPKRD